MSSRMEIRGFEAEAKVKTKPMFDKTEPTFIKTKALFDKSKALFDVFFSIHTIRIFCANCLVVRSFFCIFARRKLKIISTQQKEYEKE